MRRNVFFVMTMILGAALVGGRLTATYLRDAHSVAYVFDLNGKNRKEVKLPGLGTAGGFGGRMEDKETFYSYTSFNTPGTVYRYEQSGELSGMTRVRGFTQDDAHIFCTDDQVAEEFRGCLDMTKFVLSSLGLSNYRVRLGFRDPKSEKYVGRPELWDKAQRSLVAAGSPTAPKAVALGTVQPAQSSLPVLWPFQKKAVHTQACVAGEPFASWLMGARWFCVQKVSSVATCPPLGRMMERPWLSGTVLMVGMLA